MPYAHILVFYSAIIGNCVSIVLSRSGEGSKTGTFLGFSSAGTITKKAATEGT